MNDFSTEELFNNLVTNNIDTLDRLAEQIEKLNQLADKLGNTSGSSINGWKNSIDELETHLSNQLAAQHSELTVRLENKEVSFSKSSPYTSLLPLVWKSALIGMSLINIGSLYYLSNKQILSGEVLNTYTFGQQMKGVWGKLNNQEKQKLVKLME